VQGNARLVGFEGRFAWKPVHILTLQMSGDYVEGQNTTADVPLTFVPPMRLIYGARVQGETVGRGIVQPYFTASMETNWKQTRIDPRDFAPPGYSVASFGAGAGRIMPRGLLTVDLSVKNVFNTHYRSFMSRYKAYALAPGRVVTLRVTTPI
jgi:outer membrane receptor protein involved in Fe transport